MVSSEDRGGCATAANQAKTGAEFADHRPERVGHRDDPLRHGAGREVFVSG